MLDLKTFGGLRLEADGAPCTGAAVRPKALALLALLAPGQSGMSRDKLIAYLWPETDSAHGRHLLKQACHDLRRDLRQAELFRGRKFLQLNPDVLGSDVQRFVSALDQGDPTRSVAEYAGPFLDGFYLDGSEEFERWVEAERERLAHLAGNALRTLAKNAGARADNAAAVEWWRRLTELDPLSAEATIGRMAALAAARERAEALKVGREYTELVQRELGAAPARTVTKLMEQLRQQSDEPAGPPPDLVPPNRLAADATPLVTAQPAADVAGPARHTVWRRGAFVAAGTVVVVAILGAIVIVSGPRSHREIIAVGSIRDYTGSDTAAVGPAIAELLTGNLTRAAEPVVISTTRLSEVVGQMGGDGDARTAIKRAAIRAGATMLLEGTLHRGAGGTLRLQIQVVDLRSGFVRRAYVAEGRDLIALADSLSVQLLQGFAKKADK